VPYGRDEPEIESYKTPCPRDPYGKVFHPGDPKDQRNVSADANSSHWIALFELSAAEHAAVYIDSEDSEWVRLVLSMIRNRSGDKWHSNSIYLREILTQWLEARTLQRTKGKSKDSTTALNTLEALKFHSDLRAGDNTTKMAEGWETFRLTFIRAITNALTHRCDWMEGLACLHVCSRALKTGQQRVRSIVVTAMKDTSLLCNPVLHAMVIVAKLDSSFSQGVPGYSRETPSAAWEACVSRLPGEDALTLANCVFDSYLQKIGDDIDHRTIWSNEVYASSEINTRTAYCLGNDVSDPARGRANHHQFTLRWHEAQQRIRSGGRRVQEMSNTYIASHHIQRIG